MTEPRTPPRNRARARLALLCILLVGAALRIHGVGFGLPALNDPDEPLFMTTALDMVRNHSLNPGWFGHPGTVTLYCLALVSVAVAGVGIGSGVYADADAFVAAVYADPGILFLPARLFIVACGLACVMLTYRLGVRLGDWTPLPEREGLGVGASEASSSVHHQGAGRGIGPRPLLNPPLDPLPFRDGRERLGLIAAALLALNAVHVEYSRIIRTDVQASVFMLLCALSALAILRDGRRRDYLLAGLWVGLACATKWPAAAIAIAPLCAGLYRLSAGHREETRFAQFLIAVPIALLLASPWLVLDYPALLRDLAGEARPFHPGATGNGFLANLGWYLANPLLFSFGAAGLALVLAGFAWAPIRERTWRVVLLPFVLVFTCMICAQALLWERWIVPLLPFAALAAAWTLCALADLLRARTGRRLRWIEVSALLALAGPMLHAARLDAIERTHDTRQMASAWVRAHVPPGSSILVEEAAFDLFRGPWRFRFPLGAAGCVDPRALLGGKVRYDEVEQQRTGRPMIDLGHVDDADIPGCRADFAVLTHLDRYRAEGARFPAELARYETLVRGGRVRAVFRPEAEVSAGPVVHIVELPDRNSPS